MIVAELLGADVWPSALCESVGGASIYALPQLVSVLYVLLLHAVAQHGPFARAPAEHVIALCALALSMHAPERGRVLSVGALHAVAYVVDVEFSFAAFVLLVGLV